jgi:membrane-associated phospholipid phosphatase
MLLVLASAPGRAAAEEGAWYEGPRGRARVLHLSVAAGFGAAFVLSETVAKPALAPDTCRWCDPPGLDKTVRDALVWDDYDKARSLSNLTGYVAVPVLGVGLTAAASLRSSDARWARLVDDTVPILETVAISQVVTQIVKFSVGRARPLVYFRDVVDPDDQDNNLSFFSGHSALTFGITVSAGLVARWNDSPIEPVIWGVGLPLSFTTAYLRIAADKHYFTDVLTGSIVGVVAGLTIPRLLRSELDVAVVPSSNGLSLAGSF